MHNLKKTAYACLAAMTVSCSVFSQDVYLLGEEDKKEVIHIGEADRFWDVMKYLETYAMVQDRNIDAVVDGHLLNKDSTVHLEFSMGEECTMMVKPCKKAIGNRNYQHLVSPQEKKDIRYIVTTLGNASLGTIATSRSSLKRAGDRIRHIHPLRFLSTVFTDEELKAGMHAIRGRAVSWIWDEFLEGLTGSLKEESANQNMKPEFIQDFANQVGVGVHFILPPIQESRWKDFVNFLIDYIPRANDPNRYNM